MNGTSFGRRRFLSAAALSGLGGLAGCLGSGGVSDAGRRDFSSNPVASSLDERPRLGPARSETDITLVTFDDPSCPSCASYHGGTFGEIESKWVESGKATVYNRLYPYVAPWGRTAIHALVAVNRRRPEQFWSLKSKYYDNQDRLSADNIVEETRRFLRDTDVDADAVARAAENGASESYVSTEVSDGDDAGLYGVPLTYLFEDGEFVTTIMTESFGTFSSAVESHG
jgi:protein-disulfide isomerase